MSRVMLDLGFIQIKWYSFFILMGVIVAYTLIYKELKKKEALEDDINNVIFYSLLLGILGARIYYVIFNLDYYASNIKEIFMIWNGGLAIHGGIITTIIFLVLYTRKKKINILLLLDTMVVGVIIAQAIGRWGNFFNGEAYGRVVSKSFLEALHLPKFLINGMKINGFYREPTFLYESFLSLIGFIVLLLIKRIKSIKTGTITSIYFIWYGTSRLIIETFRSDSLMLGPIKMAQLVSIIGIIIGITLLVYSVKKNKLYINDKFYLSK